MYSYVGTFRKWNKLVEKNAILDYILTLESCYKWLEEEILYKFFLGGVGSGHKETGKKERSNYLVLLQHELWKSNLQVEFFSKVKHSQL